MSQATVLSKDVDKSRRPPETLRAHKKQQKKPITFSNPTALVTFIIGKEGDTTPFLIHKEVACAHSKVLNAAFNSNFIEGQTQTYKLEDTIEAAFKLFMQWLYSQKLVLTALDNKLDYSKLIIGPDTKSLTYLWVLADKLEMPALQNTALRAIQEISLRAEKIHTSTYPWLYKNTAPDSPLRRYSVAKLATLNVDKFAEKSKNFPKQMLVDLSLLLLRRQKKTEKKVDMTEYLVEED